jgi:hypothetical protein
MQLAKAYRDAFSIADPAAWPLATWLVLVGVLVALAVAVTVLVRRWRRDALMRRFGEEYERAVDEFGSEAAAARELRQRQRRVEHLHLRALNDRQRRHIEERWRAAEVLFIDSPWSAVRAANGLIKSIMHERGFGAEAFEQRVADLSVEHAAAVQHYRAARSLVEVNAESPSATEDLRQAMVHYGAILEDLLEPSTRAAANWREAHAH